MQPGLSGTRLLDRYAVGEMLAEGGMGQIWLARDEVMGTTVVVKIPHERFLAQPGFVDRFEQEIQELIHLEHPHVVKILAKGAHERVPFFVLQFLSGGNLKDRMNLAEGRRLAAEDVLVWLPDLARTLDFIHARGILHRDIKPQNILFDAHGHAFLSDFGLAKVLAGADSGLTESGVTPGSPDYMAPEQAMGKPLTGSIDQYALASTVYEALSGRLPYVAATPVAALLEKQSRRATDLAELVPGLPEEAARAVMRGLEPIPADRHPSCRAMSEAFRAALESAGGVAAAPLRRSRIPWKRAMLAAAAGLGIYLAVAQPFGGGEKSHVSESGGGRPSVDPGAPRRRFSPSAEGLALVDAWPGLRFQEPVWLGAAPGDMNTLYVAEKAGKVFAVAYGVMPRSKSGAPQNPPRSFPFLDITDRCASRDQGGIGSVAFHPSFADNGRVFVQYLAAREPNGFEIRVSEFVVKTGDATPAAERILLTIPKSTALHNGGAMTFGPDRLLWIGTGDDAREVEAVSTAQNPLSLLGKVLRIDVDTTDPGRGYSIPRDNPWPATPEQIAPEIFAFGLRNVWRISFDHEGGLFAAVPGARETEVLTKVVRGGNHGWPYFEGTRAFQPTPANLRGRRFTMPAFEYDRQSKDDATAIIGGAFYRGTRIPALAGQYVFADFMRGEAYTLQIENDHGTKMLRIGDTPSCSSIGEDSGGELYFALMEAGKVLALVSAGDQSTTPIEETPPQIDTSAGRRLYGEHCARCHGQDGLGRPPDVPPLRDATRVVAELPDRLVEMIMASTPGSMMPAWGQRLDTNEVLSIVNYLRGAWGHDGSLVLGNQRTSPAGVSILNLALERAVLAKDAHAMQAVGWPSRARPHLYRTDGVHAMGAESVTRAWQDYFTALGAGRVERILLVDAHYDYDLASPRVVVAWGRIFTSYVDLRGGANATKGRFLRIYERIGDSPDYQLRFDFATTPMANPAGVEVSAALPAPAKEIGFQEVVALLRGLGARAATAPHGKFWELPYEQFVQFTFEDPADGSRIPLLVPYDGKASNLVAALRSGRGISITRKDGVAGSRDVPRMPVGRSPMKDEDLAKLERWIDAGAPQVAGQASDLPRPPR